RLAFDPHPFLQRRGKRRHGGVGEGRRAGGGGQAEPPRRLVDKLAHGDRVEVQVTQEAVGVAYQVQGQLCTPGDEFAEQAAHRGGVVSGRGDGRRGRLVPGSVSVDRSRGGRAGGRGRVG